MLCNLWFLWPYYKTDAGDIYNLKFSLFARKKGFLCRDFQFVQNKLLFTNYLGDFGFVGWIYGFVEDESGIWPQIWAINCVLRLKRAILPFLPPSLLLAFMLRYLFQIFVGIFVCLRYLLGYLILAGSERCEQSIVFCGFNEPGIPPSSQLATNYLCLNCNQCDQTFAKTGKCEEACEEKALDDF